MSKTDLQHWLHEGLFEQVPINIAIIDKDYNIIEANHNFSRMFGRWHSQKCYQVYKGRSSPCSNCMAEKTFQDGKARVSDEVGVNKYGKKAHYVVHIAPIKSRRKNEKEIPFVIEMSSDITETKQWQREYQLLFDRVPCYIYIIDKDFRIVRANQRQRETFGDHRGKFCYEVFKHRKNKCENCPAEMTFQDGETHTLKQKGLTKTGENIYYIVTTTPLSRPGDEVAYVIEMATDITQIHNLQDELQEAYYFQETLINNSIDGIVATNRNEEVSISNPAAHRLLQYRPNEELNLKDWKKLLPKEFLETIEKKSTSCTLPDTILKTKTKNEIPVRLSGVVLKQQDEVIGTATFIQDLRKIKQLEKEKIEAERLAAVGQTVAGLAHSIKNILMGLEGGMYMVRTGLKKNNKDRISEGWGILERNFEKTTSLVRDFLSFAKGRLPDVKRVDPNSLVQEIIDLYVDTAKQQGVILEAKLQREIDPAFLDPDGIHTCLTNLVSNAIDACIMSSKTDRRVTIKIQDTNGELKFKVSDNGSGMDYEIKKKIFTSFFTTKGGEGTGLGLLTTRKIVQEHGGKIEVDSKPGRGSTFTMIFPRDRLPLPKKTTLNDER